MDKLRLEVLLQAVDKVTGPLKSVLAGSVATSRKLKELRDNFKQLEQQQGLINQFRNAHKASNALTAQLREQQAKVKELAANHAQAGAVTAAMTRQFKAAAAKAADLKAKLQQQQAAIQRTRDKMAQAGVSTSGLAEQERNLRAQIDVANAAISRQKDRLKALASAQANARAMAAKGAGISAAGMAGIYAGKKVVQLGAKPLDSFIQHEDAMMGVARQVQGARDAAGNLTDIYRNAESEVRALSERIPQTTVEIAAMYTAGARMEVPVEHLSSFVQLSSEMATAFDAVPDQLAESMGKVAKNFNIPIQDIRGLADSINYLDDNAISKGKDIIGVLERTGGVASIVKISGQNLAAFASTLLTLGEREETAGTAINAIFTKLAAATKGTKKFQSAVKEIGLTSESIQAGMATDAAKTMMMVTEAVAKLPKSKQLGVMVELVGMEHSDTLAKLVSKPEELKRQMGLTNGAEAQGSMAREAAARNSALSAQIIMQRNRQFNILAEAGETLKQPLLDFFNAINPILAGINKWMKANPELVGSLLKLVVVLGAFIASTGAVLIPLGLVLAKVALVRIALSALGTTVGAVAPGMGLLYKTGFLLGRALNWAGKAFSVVKLAMKFAWPWVLKMTKLGLITNAIFALLDAVVTFAKDWDGTWANLGASIWKGIEAGLDSATFGIYGFLKKTISETTATAAAVQGTARATAAAAVIASMPAVVSAADAPKLQAAKAQLAEAAAQADTAISPAAKAFALGQVNLQRGGDDSNKSPMLPIAPKATTVNSTTTNNIVVNPAPGMDERAFARAVASELERRENAQSARRRSGYTDME